MGDDEIEEIVGGVFGLPTFFYFRVTLMPLKTLGSGAKPQLLQIVMAFLTFSPSFIVNDTPSFIENRLTDEGKNQDIACQRETHMPLIDWGIRKPN